MKRFLSVALLGLLVLLTSCEPNSVIVNDVPEREANEIVVYLSSKGINAEKIASTSSSPGAGNTKIMWSISVPPKHRTEAMAILNQIGLPRQQGANLLELFAKQGLMSSEREETIRYHAGLSQQMANTISKIDGVIDADVQISFPPTQTIPGEKKGKITASVYVKHDGILDNPNAHLVTKIKRLLSGSISGLNINDVTVISDRSRFTDVSVDLEGEKITGEPKDYVSIWSIKMSRASASRFRALFFTLMFISVILLVAVAWLIWKVYPLIRKHGLRKELLSIKPLEITDEKESPPEEEEVDEEDDEDGEE